MPRPSGGLALASVKLETLRYHPVQARLWRENKRFKVVPAGRRSGKTELAKRYVARALMLPKPWPDPRYFCAAPTRLQAKDIYWTWFKRHLPAGLIADISETELSIRLIHGPELRVLGLDEPARIEGPPWDGGILDEYGDMHSSAWPEHVRPALSDRGGWCWLIGVPEGLNHYYKTWTAVPTLPGWGGYTWPTADIQDPEEVESARRELDPRTFRQEYEASFEAHTGRVYYAFDRAKDVHDFPLPDHVGSDALPWRVGIDFNVNPMSAVLGWQNDDAGEPYVWRNYRLPGSNTDELGRRILADIATERLNSSPVIAYPDPTGKRRSSSSPVGQSDHSILQELGFEVRARNASPSVRDRINCVNTRFCTGDGRRRAHIHTRCTDLIQALDGLVYREGTNEPDKAHGLDHLPDGLGYWWELEFPIHGNAESMKF